MPEQDFWFFKSPPPPSPADAAAPPAPSTTVQLYFSENVCYLREARCQTTRHCLQQCFGDSFNLPVGEFRKHQVMQFLALPHMFLTLFFSCCARATLLA
jgi:hypothetical protein